MPDILFVPFIPGAAADPSLTEDIDDPYHLAAARTQGIMSDARYPHLTAYNRMETFRACLLSPSRKSKFGLRGWYCTG